MQCGCARLAELGEVLAVEAQMLLLQVRPARLRLRTQPLPLRVAFAPLRFLLRTPGVVGGARRVQTVGQGEAAAGEREVIPTGLGE